MNAFLLAAILVSQMIIIAVQLWIVNLLTARPDFSKEDEQVKAATSRSQEAAQEIADAQRHLPPQN